MSEPILQIIVTICALWGAAAYIRCFHLQHQINKLEKRLNGFVSGSEQFLESEWGGNNDLPNQSDQPL